MGRIPAIKMGLCGGGKTVHRKLVLLYVFPLFVVEPGLGEGGDVERGEKGDREEVG